MFGRDSDPHSRLCSAQVLDYKALTSDDETTVQLAGRSSFRPVCDTPSQDAALGAYAQGLQAALRRQPRRSSRPSARTADTSPEVGEFFDAFQATPPRHGAHGH